MHSLHLLRVSLFAGAIVHGVHPSERHRRQHHAGNVPELTQPDLQTRQSLGGKLATSTPSNHPKRQLYHLTRS